MGVDFFTCSRCNDTFPDCGPYKQCGYPCGRVWCSSGYDNCAELDGYIVAEKEDEDVENKSCSYCRNEKATDFNLLTYMLTLNNTTREEVEQDYLNLVRNK